MNFDLQTIVRDGEFVALSRGVGLAYAENMLNDQYLTIIRRRVGRGRTYCVSCGSITYRRDERNKCHIFTLPVEITPASPATAHQCVLDDMAMASDYVRERQGSATTFEQAVDMFDELAERLQKAKIADAMRETKHPWSGKRADE